jgi:hypothetical protein
VRSGMYLLRIVGHPSRSPRLAIPALSAFAAALVLAAPASAALQPATPPAFGAPGVEAGQLSEPAGVATNDTSHDVYLADPGNHRIDRFAQDGTFLGAWGYGVADGTTEAPQTCTTTCFAGLPGSGEGQLSDPTAIAVDNSAGASAEDVYVVDSDRVLKFSASGAYISTNDGSGRTPTPEPFTELAAVAIDGNGDVWSVDSATGDVDEFGPGGTYVTGSQFADGYESTKAIAVDVGATKLYLMHGEAGETSAWDPASPTGGTLVDDGGTAFTGPPLSISRGGALAVDPVTGDLFVEDIGMPGFATHYATVIRYSSSGQALEHFGGQGQIAAASLFVPEPQGIAFDPGATHPGTAPGGLYAAEAPAGDVRIFAPPAVKLSTGPATATGPTSATLTGTVDPQGRAITDCHFDYVEAASYQPAAADPYAAGGTVPCVPSPSAIGTGSTDVAVTAELNGLAPTTLYHFRLQATNALGTSFGTDQIKPAGFGFLPGLPGFDATALNQDLSADTQAGSHPYTANTTFVINTSNGQNPDGDLKDAAVNLPPGLIGNPTAVPACPLGQFETPRDPDHYNEYNSASCPAASAVGLAAVHLPELHFVSVYNLVPPPGFPAELGFNVLGVPVTLFPRVRTGGDYGLTVESREANQALLLSGVTVTLWGVPAEESHDEQRGVCLAEDGEPTGRTCDAGVPPATFLSLPTSCLGPQTTSIDADSWQEPGPLDPFGDPLLTDPRWKTDSVLSHDASGNPVGNDGCNRLDFSPTIEARPTTDVADAPSGLHVDLHFPQREQEADPEGTVESDLKDAAVTLPPGLTVNPSSANGLAACSSHQIGLTSQVGAVPIRTTPAPAECPDASKLGTVRIDTPLLDHELEGAIYLATPFDNPFDSLLALYIAVDDHQSGIVVKLAGRVEPNPVTGQLTATFAEQPQLPFEDLRVDFFEGAGASLRTPATCGGYQTTTDLTPWTTPEGVDAHPSDAFAISQSPAAGSCPTNAAALPNKPAFTAGTATPRAATYSPFLLTLTRGDGSQELSSIDTTLPAGLTGKLAGVPYCPESGLATAAARNKPGDGAIELSSPSCPSASQVGTVTVGAGAGPTPFYATGKAYLAGPYKGAPLSLAVITPAIAGPFDLGDVLVRTALYVNPETAQITAKSDPFPQILQGIPLDIRSIALNMDRPDFTLNPTSCDRFSVSGSSTSTLGQAASISSPFQVGECSKLAFRPKVSLSLKGGTVRNRNPALKAVVTYPQGSGYANTAKAVVALPHSEFLDQANIGTVCTRVQFAEGTTPGEKCPKASIYGHARATTPLLEAPLEGPVYLRSSSHKLPDLVAALNGQIQVTLDGRIDTAKGGGIRTSFEATPDAPVTKFILEMQGGKHKGLLVNSEDICRKPQRAVAALTGQNGKVSRTEPLIANSCGKAKHHKNHRTGKKRARTRGGGEKGRS